jgi:hypothetical protein
MKTIINQLFFPKEEHSDSSEEEVKNQVSEDSYEGSFSGQNINLFERDPRFNISGRSLRATAMSERDMRELFSHRVHFMAKISNAYHRGILVPRVHP